MKRGIIERAIEQDFLLGVQEIFKSNLLFGFIGGSVAKGYWKKDHDIDIFICLNEPIDSECAKDYLSWYGQLHSKYGFLPDFDYPGEIVERGNLVDTLRILNTFELKLKVDDLQTREAILWADMITGGKIGLVGNGLDFFYFLERQHRHYPEEWKSRVLSLISNEDRNQWKNKDYGLIMERFMRYTGDDKRAFYKKYSIEDVSIDFK